jgi:hypothetical protein
MLNKGTSYKANPDQILLLVRNYFEGEATVAEAEQRAIDSQCSKDRIPDATIGILSADTEQSGAGQ